MTQQTHASETRPVDEWDACIAAISERQQSGVPVRVYLQDWNAVLNAIHKRGLRANTIARICKCSESLARRYLNATSTPGFEAGTRLKSYLEGSPRLKWLSVRNRLRKVLAKGVYSKTEIANACGFTRQAINYWVSDAGTVPSFENGFQLYIFLSRTD